MNYTTTPLVWKPLWDAMRSTPDAWIPTTEEMYWDMLEALPPLRMRGGAFLMSEADHSDESGHPVYACFLKHQGHYLARYMNCLEFDEEL
jgi:hypothetical protein